MQYSTDGINFTDFHQITRTTTGFIREIVDLSSIPAVNNNPNFAFRVVSEFESTATGAGSASYVESGNYYSANAGTIRFDWLNVFANPNTAVVKAPLNIEKIGANVVLSWTNSLLKLQAAPLVTGVYTNIPGATSPYTNAITSAPKFFLLTYP